MLNSFMIVKTKDLAAMIQLSILNPTKNFVKACDMKG